MHLLMGHAGEFKVACKGPSLKEVFEFGSEGVLGDECLQNFFVYDFHVYPVGNNFQL